jgi:NAD(P)-dependent dehydrogenase (short-subunit alcohol dehydrogenase family)
MKVVVITGGSKGIGKATAIRFSELGYRVIICSRTKKEIDEVSRQISCGSFFCDVRYPDHVKKMFDSIKEQEGRIDVLVNCAGILGPMGHLEDSNINEWKDAIDTNLIGTVSCIQQAIPIMKKQRSGHIINFCGGGVGGDKLPIGFSAYNTSKFAVGGFTEAVSKELSFHNIKINAISPGAIDTDMARSRWVKGTSPDKVVDLIVFLATTDKNINGRIISAVWDNYKDETYENESLFTLRRVVH